MVTGPAGPSLREPAEQRHAGELARLAAADCDPKPPGWVLSARAVRRFILGDAKLDVARKFFGDDPLVDRAIVSLMGDQDLMLVGEPGTAKSLLSELLAAAVCGSTDLVIQGSVGTNEDHLRYGWDYALLLSNGPSWQALVASPMMEAMRAGRIVRLEELTRCAPEIQDVLISLISLISLMSEKALSVPELGQGTVVRATPGFLAAIRDTVEAAGDALDRTLFEAAVDRLADETAAMPPLLAGAVTALAVQAGRRAPGWLAQEVANALSGPHDADHRVGPLHGVLLVVPELVRRAEGMTLQLDRVLGAMQEDTFIALLPHLRRAFTTLDPREAADLAAQVVAGHGLDRHALQTTMPPGAAEAELLANLAHSQALAALLAGDGLGHWVAP